MRPFDEQDAEILAGRMKIHLMAGDDVGSFDILEKAWDAKKQETNESGFEDYDHANEVPLGLSKILSLETLNLLEEHEIKSLGQYRRLTRQSLLKIRGFGQARFEESEKASEDLAIRWRKAKKLKDARRRRKKEEAARMEREGNGGIARKTDGGGGTFDGKQGQRSKKQAKQRAVIDNRQMSLFA